MWVINIYIHDGRATFSAPKMERGQHWGRVVGREGSGWSGGDSVPHWPWVWTTNYQIQESWELEISLEQRVKHLYTWTGMQTWVDADIDVQMRRNCSEPLAPPTPAPGARGPNPKAQFRICSSLWCAHIYLPWVSFLISLEITQTFLSQICLRI